MTVTPDGGTMIIESADVPTVPEPILRHASQVGAVLTIFKIELLSAALSPLVALRKHESFLSQPPPRRHATALGE